MRYPAPKLALIAWLACFGGCAANHANSTEDTSAAEVGTGVTESPAKAEREFDPFIGPRWIGNGISYGPHRDGQHPDRDGPTREQLREDLHILSQHWNLLRMYGSRGATETVLEIIRTDKLPLKVMVGAWISPEARLAEDGSIVETFREAKAANEAEVATAIRLANAFPEAVVAISVGNETQVFWSSHRVRSGVLIDYIRQARAKTRVPVTTADDFRFWISPESAAIADEVDFIVTHAYAMWNGQTLENALPFTKEQYDAVAARHPEHQVVLGEAGWATQKHDQGEQGPFDSGRRRRGRAEVVPRRLPGVDDRRTRREFLLRSV